MENIVFTLREGEEFIPLNQLLKATGVVEKGSDANSLIEQNLVQHNGQTEERKRAKIKDGDTVQIGHTKIVVQKA